MRSIELAAIILAATVSGCHGRFDPRCDEERYYCLDEQAKVSYLKTVSDMHLISIAKIEFSTSKPPTGFYVFREMQRRGPEKSKAIMYLYASGDSNKYLLDGMTRVLTHSKNACNEWVDDAPFRARESLKTSCNRVYGSENT